MYLLFCHGCYDNKARFPLTRPKTQKSFKSSFFKGSLGSVLIPVCYVKTFRPDFISKTLLFHEEKVTPGLNWAVGLSVHVKHENAAESHTHDLIRYKMCSVENEL